MENEAMTKAEWREKDERILKSGVMKSIHEGGRLPEGPIEVQKVWLKDMFDYSIFQIRVSMHFLKNFHQGMALISMFYY